MPKVFPFKRSRLFHRGEDLPVGEGLPDFSFVSLPFKLTTPRPSQCGFTPPFSFPTHRLLALLLPEGLVLSHCAGLQQTVIFSLG